MTKSNDNKSWLLKTRAYRVPGMENRKSRLTILLTLTVLFNFGLILYRNFVLTGHWWEIRDLSDLIAEGRGPSFLFLVWNLFLAWIPYGLTLLIKQRQAAPVQFGLLLLWLLFFPNAPYLITDLLHLRERLPVPIWYDMMTIFSFAWTGLMFGYLSLTRVQRLLRANWGHSISNIVTIFVLILAGLGIYIGRFLRWNSWDIIAQPGALFADVGSIFLSPAVHWPAIGAGILVSVFLLLSYATLQSME